MKNRKSIRKITLGLTALLSGSTIFDNGCFNTLASINVCGTVLTFCTPGDQLNLLFPYLEVPDFESDPSCTIPLGCGEGDLYDIPATPDGHSGFPGGDAPDQPSDDSGGGTGGGG